MKRSRKSALEKDGDISMATRYQVGGEVEEELDADDVDSGAGALGQLDPSTMMMAAFGRFTTPEAQQYSKDILDELLASRRQPSSSTAIDAMKLQAEQVRKALRNARERLESQEYNKGELRQLLAYLGFEVDYLETADVQDSTAGHSPGWGRIGRLVKHRESDLGQYLFARARNSRPAGEKRPRFLFHSYPPEELEGV